MRITDIIRKKRDGYALTKQEIEWVVSEYSAGAIPDYQVSALVMAIWFNSMNDEETVWLTNSMANSGDVIDLSCFGTNTVDKHSTGGVGDKTTLVVAPIVASIGCKIAKMSGRGLGHTGGTIDKLESIPGYKTMLSPNEFFSQVEKVGIAVIGQSGNLAPADKKLYALRDVTSTVDSIPLITSSIMSKKIAAGSHSIVLDVKVGSGAFMKTIQDAEKLAKSMVNIGKQCGRNMAAVLTNMDVPLGRAIGNSLEVKEAVKVLKGEKSDLAEVSIALATEMVSLCCGIESDKAKRLVEEAVLSGSAFSKMKEWVAAQGGNADYLDDTSLFETAEYIVDIESRGAGYLCSMDSEEIGNISVILGAGRQKKDEDIDYNAGIELFKKTGDIVEPGDILCRLHTNRPEILNEAKERFYNAIKLRENPLEQQQLIYKIIR